MIISGHLFVFVIFINKMDEEMTRTIPRQDALEYIDNEIMPRISREKAKDDELRQRLIYLVDNSGGRDSEVLRIFGVASKSGIGRLEAYVSKMDVYLRGDTDARILNKFFERCYSELGIPRT